MRLFRFTPKNMNGILAIEKPSGVTSAAFLDRLQKIFTSSEVFEKDLNEAKELKRSQLASDKKWSNQRIENKVKGLKIKMGHGGTLDPLASGVLIVGIGSGTKKLQHYLTGCNKTYKTKALLGIATTTGDSEGEIITKSPIDHITKEMVIETGAKFIGDLKQTPPIFSALKMNGKPLYDYAREGKPLPKPIKARDVKVYDVKVETSDLLSRDHEFAKLESQLDENGQPKDHLLKNNPSLNDAPLYYSTQYLEAHPDDLPPSGANYLPDTEELPLKLPIISFTADVSSGTYIRSLVSDFGRALKSSAYMVELIRTRQSNWELGKNVFKMEDFTERDPRVWGVALKKVFEQGDSVNLDNLFTEIESTMADVFKKEQEIASKSSESVSDQEKVVSNPNSTTTTNTDTTDTPSATKHEDQNNSNGDIESDLPKKRNIEEVE